MKYEEVYLRAYDSISAARQGVGRYLTFYNQTRPHRALDGKTPEEVYCDNLTTRPSRSSRSAPSAGRSARLWRSVTYEEVYLRAYDSISAARQGVGSTLTFYNQTRPHRALAERVNEFGTLAVGI